MSRITLLGMMLLGGSNSVFATECSTPSILVEEAVVNSAICWNWTPHRPFQIEVLDVKAAS